MILSEKINKTCRPEGTRTLSSNDSKSDVLALAIDTDGFDIMIEPMIPSLIINLATHLIPSMYNSVLNTSMESAAKEHDVTIDDSSSFFDIPMKYGTANHDSTTLHHAKENNSNACHALVNPDRANEKQFILHPKKLRAGCLNFLSRRRSPVLIIVA